MIKTLRILSLPLLAIMYLLITRTFQTSVSKETPIPFETWIQRLHMEPLIPEGGFYVETYRSSEFIEKACLPERFPRRRNISGSIYFLFTPDNFSAFHRNKSDELWNYHYGSPVQFTIINKDGSLSTPILGIHVGEPQRVIPHDTWFTAVPLEGYSLVGCALAPGYDHEDFELAKRDTLTKEFPQHSDVIKRFTRS